MTGGLLRPVVPPEGAVLRFSLDGTASAGHAGDTVLAALLRQGARIGRSEFDGTPRAGFCLMGSCQECTLWDAQGRRLRACMVDLRDGMVLCSTPLAPEAGDD